MCQISLSQAEMNRHVDEVLNLASVNSTGKESDLRSDDRCKVSVAKLNTVEVEIRTPTFKN